MVLKSVHVLIVDDEKSNRKLLKTFLMILGAKVTCCDSGESAYNKISLQTFGCIVSDINMPFMDGVELLSKIRHELLCETPVILISGAVNLTQSELTDKGAQGFLQKPFPLESLEKMIIDCVL
jgi:CheY-like chemotaxis protein